MLLIQLRADSVYLVVWAVWVLVDAAKLSPQAQRAWPIFPVEETASATV